ncbi:transglutaminase-like domain-containing protein [Streptomyces phyllanthi]|uniref:Transglutaminase domain-containing protein n=1 Tax=Streptomyces phyllanthi TaxID=1803180 RepID=A0A5N8VYA5_9ACTN|nr:transglutaminase-like domain-containing protein [Streptomyces phyllanthi]MPY40250.1 transglutaminase domain-containing protein [Streptomyces phyllanthi]
MDLHLEHLGQTPFSDPGDLDTSTLPRDPRQLAVLVRNLIVHRAEGERVGWTVPEERGHDDPEARYVTEVLRILRVREHGDRPFGAERAPEERFVGTCRDFSLLLCSLLRATGTPARIRCGFAGYFKEGWYDDHWVTEYRLPDGTWRLADAQVLHHSYDLPFDPLDMPRDRFLVGGDAWRMCREGRADPETFGVDGIEDVKGLWYIRANTLADLAAAVGGVELLPWDFWGPEIRDDKALTEGDIALTDMIAAARTDEELRELYRDPRLTVPDEIGSYVSRTGYTAVRRVTLNRG